MVFTKMFVCCVIFLFLQLTGTAVAGDLLQRTEILEAEFETFFLKCDVTQGDELFARQEIRYTALVATYNDSIAFLSAQIDSIATLMTPVKKQLTNLGEDESTSDLNIALTEIQLEYHQGHVTFSEFELQMLKRMRDARADLENSFNDLQQALSDHDQWNANEGSITFSENLMDLLVDVRSSRSSPEAAECLSRVRLLRQHLAGYYREIARKTGYESIVIEVLIGDEPCYLLLDTGSELVTLSAKMIAALGWSDLPVTEHSFLLAGGKKTSGLLVSLPEVSYDGFSAREVDAGILPAGHPGHDGLLGMSYLGRFIMEIDMHDTKPLHLKNK